MFLPDSLEKQGMFPVLYRLLILFLGDASKTEKSDIVPYLKLPGYITSLSWMLAGNVKTLGERQKAALLTKEKAA